MRASRGIAVVLIASLGAVCWSSTALAEAPRLATANMDTGVKRGTCPDATISVSILTDNYGGETTWDITDGGGAIIASGGPYDAATQYDVDVCVDSAGCYEFTIYDAYGDGICCAYGSGSYEVSYNGTVVGSGGEFGASETVSDIGDGCSGGGGTCTIQVVIMTDNYGGETTWTVTEQGSGTVMGSGGPYDAATLYTVDVAVDCGGCYDFTILDAYGDGICCAYGNGYYEVYYEGGQVGIGGEFGASETVADIGGGCAATVGACCDAGTGVCTDGVLPGDCLSPLQFTSETLCADLPLACGESPPPCGANMVYDNGAADLVNGTRPTVGWDDTGIIDDFSLPQAFGTAFNCVHVEMLDNTTMTSLTTARVRMYSAPGGIAALGSFAAATPVFDRTYSVASGTMTMTDSGLDAFGHDLLYLDMTGVSADLGAGNFGMLLTFPGTGAVDFWASSPDVGEFAQVWGVQADAPGDAGMSVAFNLKGGEYTPVFGACCDDDTGVCADNVEALACSGRFAADTACAALTPPCGGAVGACCSATDVCTAGTQADCGSGGGTFVGEGTSCTPDPCACTPVLVSIFTDNYPGETTWELVEDGTGTVVASGGPYTDPLTLHEIETCVDPTSCYTFTIFDAFGDGICCAYGDGSYEVYYDGALVGSGGEFGAFESVGFIGGGCVVPTGACCDGTTCTGTIAEGKCAFTWHAGEDCGSFTCPVIAGLTCPGDALFSQGAHGAADNWSAGTSEIDANGINYLRSESFSGVVGDICDIHWWGLDLYNDGAAWGACSESDPTYIVTFYNDAGGQPGGVVQSYTVQATVTPTNELLAGLYPLNYYTVDLLSPCVTMSDGWVSVQGVGDLDCWFLWQSSPDGNGSSCVSTGGVQDCTYAYDNAVCLTGLYTPSFGACCDDDTGSCTDNVEIINCNGRFAENTLCADLTPPCGGAVGACCSATDVCTVGTQADCGIAGGTFLGEGTSCTPDPCACTPVLVSIFTDNYPGETTWELVEDGTGTVVASGGPYADPATQYDTETCVDPTSCYTFTIFDAYGDGICCAYGDGSYEVYYDGALVGSGGEFDDFETVPYIGGGCVIPPGACCVGGACTDNVQQQDCTGTYFSATACANVTCPAGNDACPDAILVNPGDTVTGTTIGANNSGAPTCGTSNTAADVWYSVVGNGNRLTASTCSSTWDTKLTVYTDGCSTLTCVGGNDDSGCAGRRPAAQSIASMPILNPPKTPLNVGPSGIQLKDLIQVKRADSPKRDPQALQSEVEWCSEPGRVYLILVHGFSSSEGDFTLDIIDGTSCSGACCVQEVGSCACVEVVEGQCTGTFIGEGTTCADTPNACNCNENEWCDVEELQPGGAIVFEATGIGMDIPDGVSPGITHVINVSGGGTVADLNVGLDISHTWVGDLCVSLTHPNGTTSVDLILRMGLTPDTCDATGCCGCSDDDLLVTLDDEGAGGSIEDGCGSGLTSPPNYTPQEALSAFDGLGLAGDWTLTVNDNAGADTGTLNGWSLSFNAGAAAGLDCNGNGIPDDCEDDCNGNGIPDDCDIADGTSTDCDGDGVPDECNLVDCNTNTIHDACDIQDGTSQDCNGNDVPDECDIASGGSQDCQPDDIPDECQLGTSSGVLTCSASNVVGTGSIACAGGGITTENTFARCFANVDGGDVESVSFGVETAEEVGGGPVIVTVSLFDDTNGCPPNSAALVLLGQTTITLDGAGGDNGTVVTATFGTPVAVTAGTDLVVDISYGPDNRFWPGSNADGQTCPGYLMSNSCGIADYTDIASIGFPDMHLILQANVAAAATNDCNGNGVPDECDTPVCGNGCLEGAEECDDGGESATCDADCTFVVCGDGTLNATAGEECDATPGDTSDCCTDGCLFEAARAFVCRAGSGDSCDPDETCPGGTAACPADIFDDGSTACRPGTGDICDPDEFCTGNAGEACPVDLFEPGTTECRAALGECGLPESCPGFAGGSCPGDSHKPEGTECGTDATECKEHDVCSVDGICLTAPFFECGPTDGCCPPVGGANGACGPRDHDLDCGDPVPTVSAWGLMVLALLLMVAGKVYFGRRRVIA